MLCIDIQNNCIIMRDINGGQCVRLFFSKSNLPPVYDYLKPFLSQPYICISRLIVNTNYRNKGLGSLAMKLLINSNPGCNFIVSAKPDNFTEINKLRLYKFYNSFGFKPFKETEDGLIMLSILNI